MKSLLAVLGLIWAVVLGFFQGLFKHLFARNGLWRTKLWPLLLYIHVMAWFGLCAAAFGGACLGLVYGVGVWLFTGALPAYGPVECAAMGALICYGIAVLFLGLVLWDEAG